MLTALTVLVFIWATYWAIRSLKKMTSGDYSVVHPVLLVTYAFLALPLFYELFWGIPDLQRFPGIERAQNDLETRYFYLLYVFLIFPIMIRFAKNKSLKSRSLSGQSENSHLNLPVPFKALSILLLLSPILLVPFAPEPGIYTNYGVSIGANLPEAAVSYHALITAAGRLSIIGAVTVILSAKKVTASLVFWVCLALLGSVWLVGKRSVIALILMGLLFALWQRGLLRGKRMLYLGMAAISFLGLFSVTYQDAMRSDLALTSTYEGFRLDYTRDTSIKLAIYSINNPSEVQITNKGQTIPLYVAQLVPRSLWPEKPYPYAQYVTSAAFLEPPKLWGWGLTTSWFGEWVSNIGLVAFGIAPALLGFLCRIVDRTKLSIARAVQMVVLILLVVMHVAAFSILIPVSVFLFLWDRLVKQKPTPEKSSSVATHHNKKNPIKSHPSRTN